MNIKVCKRTARLMELERKHREYISMLKSMVEKEEVTDIRELNTASESLKWVFRETLGKCIADDLNLRI